MRKQILDVMFSMFLCPMIGAAGCLGESGLAGSAEMMAGPAAMPAQDGPAELTIQMVDGPINRLKEVNVEIQKVIIQDEQGATTELGTPNKVVDLLKLQDGLSDTLGSTRLAAGRYTELRLLLGSYNVVRLADDSLQTLKTPSGQESGIKLPLNLELADNDNKALVLDFDVAESVHVAGVGRYEKYMLRPVLHAVEKQASAAIRGRLTSAGSGAPIAGAAVFAQARDKSGRPQIVRRVRSDADGRYLLDLLPTEQSYVVVTQPVDSGVTYMAAVSSALSPSLMSAPTTWDAALQAAPAVGGLLVQVGPAASDAQGDTCMVMQGDPSQPVIVASDVTTRDNGEQAKFDALPAGSYLVQCLRRSPDGDGGTISSYSQMVSATVTSGTSATVPVSF